MSVGSVLTVAKDVASEVFLFVDRVSRTLFAVALSLLSEQSSSISIILSEFDADSLRSGAFALLIVCLIIW